MPNTIGLGSGFSIKKETTWGTAVVPTVAVPLISESLKLDIRRIEAKTLKGGNYLDTSASWRVGASVGGGDTQTLLWSSGANFWEAMLGQTTTTGVGPFTHTSVPVGALPSYTLQVSYGGVGATTARKQCVGAMVDSWEIKAALDAPVTLGLTWAYKSEALVASTALAGSYPAAQTAYSYADTVISGGATPAGCVESLTFTGNNNLLKDQLCLGSTTISQPARNGFGTITGSMDVLLESNSVADYGKYTAGTELSLIVTFTSGAKTMVITANVRIDGATPTVAGEGVIKLSIPFKVLAPTTDASAFTVVATNSDAVGIL